MAAVGQPWSLVWLSGQDRRGQGELLSKLSGQRARLKGSGWRRSGTRLWVSDQRLRVDFRTGLQGQAMTLGPRHSTHRTGS